MKEVWCRIQQTSKALVNHLKSELLINQVQEEFKHLYLTDILEDNYTTTASSRCYTSQTSFIVQSTGASGFDRPCLRTWSADFTTVTVKDGKSEPPAGTWGFNQNG